MKKGDLLGEIDPSPYQAQLDQAIANRDRDQAHLENAKIDLDRYTKLAQQKSIATQTADSQKAIVDQLVAMIKSDEAIIESARVNLGYTNLTSPIDGVTGIRQIDIGNIIYPTDVNGLVDVTQIEPISLIFTLPEADFVPIQERLSQGPITVFVDSQDGKQLDQGTLNLIDNQIIQTTGTIRLRAQFPNKPPPPTIHTSPTSLTLTPSPPRSSAHRPQREIAQQTRDGPSTISRGRHSLRAPGSERAQRSRPPGGADPAATGGAAAAIVAAHGAASRSQSTVTAGAGSRGAAGHAAGRRTPPRAGPRSAPPRGGRAVPRDSRARARARTSAHPIDLSVGRSVPSSSRAGPSRTATSSPSRESRLSAEKPALDHRSPKSPSTSRLPRRRATHQHQHKLSQSSSILRRYRRSLLLRLEHPHRSALENHVHRTPRLGNHGYSM